VRAERVERGTQQNHAKSPSVRPADQSVVRKTKIVCGCCRLSLPGGAVVRVSSVVEACSHAIQGRRGRPNLTLAVGGPLAAIMVSRSISGRWGEPSSVCSSRNRQSERLSFAFIICLRRRVLAGYFWAAPPNSFSPMAVTSSFACHRGSAPRSLVSRSLGCIGVSFHWLESSPTAGNINR